MCHMPQIDNLELVQDNKIDQSDKMVWYFPKCSHCISTQSSTSSSKNEEQKSNEKEDE